MSTDHPGNQAPARLKRPKSQRQILINTTQDNLPHPDTYQTQPLSTALAAQGFSLAGYEDSWQKPTLPVKAAQTSTSALTMPEFSLEGNLDVSQRLTLPVKIPE